MKNVFFIYHAENEAMILVPNLFLFFIKNKSFKNKNFMKVNTRDQQHARIYFDSP